MEDKNTPIQIQTATLPLSIRGKPLEEKAPTLFYFSLSAEDSLLTEPFCSPARLLAERNWRIISATMPGHEGNARPLNIRQIWQERSSDLKQFLNDLTCAVKEILPSVEGTLATAGLSRGALIAAHLAASLETIDAFIGYAPLTFLPGMPELDLIHLAPSLKRKRVFMTVGHHDTMIETSRVIQTHAAWTHDLGAKARQECAHSLLIVPSIGKEGHGTAETTFVKGIEWLDNN